MIAGTEFVFGEFEHLWPRYQMRAARGIKDDAVQDARDKLRIGRAACIEGRAGLVVFELNDGPRGGMQMMILMAVGGTIEAFRMSQGAILTIARDIGATELAFKTWRRGWSRMLGPQWRQSGDTFTREV